MNRLADTRSALAAAVAPVLPGRTSSHPPAGTRFAAPYIWVEQPSITRSVIGNRTQVAVATFPVWIAYDGADRSQVDGLDDLVARAWDALSAVAHAEPVLARPTTTEPGHGVSLRAVEISVDVTLTAVTLCPPEAPGTAPIPPVPLPEEATRG